MRCRAPHDGALAGLREHRADGLDPVEALGDEDALHLAAVRQVLLEPHLGAAEPAQRTVVTANAARRQRLKIFSIAAPSDGRDVAMQRDSGCAVEVRTLLPRDRRSLVHAIHSCRAPTARFC